MEATSYFSEKYMIMRSLFFLFIFMAACSTINTEDTDKTTVETTVEKPAYAMVIHGGAGAIRKEYMSDELEAQFLASLNRALDKGEEILSSGGGSLDAVEQVIKIMEDDSLFNAGKGAVFTHEERIEMDASIMVGADLKAGAVAGVQNIRNPISAARAVMERSNHVLLAREGAEEFAREHHLEMVDPAYFRTQDRLKRLKSALEREEEQKKNEKTPFEEKFGTVGVVALDNYGHIVAGTSTGGMTNKRWARIGDSPIIGAGTYADNDWAGVSCTGHGEYYIRYAVAYDVIAQMKYKGMSLQESADAIIHDKLKPAGGEGGLIALDAQGNIVMSFNSAGMYRGYVKPGERDVAIYGGE
jgi:beta-aspartyl-peptidase (threonine type)